MLNCLLLGECNSKLCVAENQTLGNHLLERYSKQNIKPEISFSIFFFFSLWFKN